MNIHEEKINNANVHVLKVPKVDKKNQVGLDYFDILYSNIFLVARKASGKTNCIFNILKNSINKDTHIIFFVGTINKDDTYKEIQKYLDKKDVSYQCFDSMYDGKKNRLEELIKDLNEETEGVDEETEKDDYVNPVYKYMSTEKQFSITLKKQKPKLIAPRYIFVFDDISNELRTNPFVKTFLKKNRHYKNRTIISSQYVNDLINDAREQIDYWICFGGHNDDKLKVVYECTENKITFNQFKELYDYATEEKYNFFYIDKNDHSYRKNFNTKLTLQN